MKTEGKASAGHGASAGTGAAARIRGSSPDRVADAIVRGILLRQYTVGQRLVEADLTRSLGVSRGTVREALRLLAANGVVELTPHRGAVVRRLSPREAQDLVEVIEMLAGLAARLAARKIDQGGNRPRFEAITRKLFAPHTGSGLDRILDERLDLYKIMFGIAGNGELDRVLPVPRAHLFRTQFHQYLTERDLRSMVTEYRSVATAVLAGDEARAESRMRAHIRKTGERSIPRLAVTGRT